MFSANPVTLSRRLSDTVVGYERAAFAVVSTGRPGDEHGWSVLERVIHVRDGLYRYATCLERLAEADHPVLGDLDPEPFPPVALDHTWAAVTGLINNIQLLSGVIASFPARRWCEQAVVNGCGVTAMRLANYGAHEAVHHLQDVAADVSSSGLDYSDRVTGPGPRETTPA